MAVAISLTTALLVGGFSYWRIVDITRAEASAKLYGQTQLIAPRLSGAFDAIRNDILTISRTPPFLGLARSTRGGGLDLQDESTTAQWVQRLETIFQSSMQAKPAYTRMRLIGVADAGRELVAVQVVDGRIVALPTDEMKQRAELEWFGHGLNLSRGNVYFSSVTPSFESGVADTSIPVIRALTPIYDNHDRIFGVLVINILFDDLIQSILQDMHSDGDIYLVTGDGDYFVRDQATGRIDYAYRGITEPDVPAPVLFLHESGSSGATYETEFDGEHVVIQQAQLTVGDGAYVRLMKIGLLLPEHRFLAGADAVRENSLLITVVLMIVVAAIAMIIARNVTAPLLHMVDEVRAFESGRRELTLPTDRRDEIGTLSRAFRELVDSLEQARQTEQEARVRVETLRAQARDALVTIDEQGTIVEFNTSAEKLLGFTAEDVIGSNVQVIMPHETADTHGGFLQPETGPGYKTVKGTVRELVVQRKNGATVAVELAISEIRFNGQVLFDGAMRDITERKELERQAEKRTASLERSNRSLDEFAYIASHDLREPLRGIANLAQFLREDYGDKLEGDGQRWIERMQVLCERSSKLISDLLYWSRLNTGEFAHEQLDLDDIVAEVRNSLQEFLDERNARIEVEGPLPTIGGDHARILSLFMNLVVNGIKYNDSAQPIVTIGFQPVDYAERPDVRHLFRVCDNGIGIAPEFYESVFAIFKRLNGEKAYGPGSGAGLSFVKRIVERHGGWIWLESEPGNGTTFYFTLGDEIDEND